MYVWREGDSGNVVRRNTRLVIEGYPRSANTFAETAFKFSQPRPVKTADHVHVPAQVILAARYGIPICLLVRKPEDLVRSLVVKHTRVLVPDALKGYANYYKTCLSYRKSFLVATYEQVTTNFGRVVERINERFGTDFTPFSHSPDNVQRVFEILDKRNTRINGGKSSMSYYPNRKKAAAENNVCMDAPYAALLQKCNDLYSVYLELSAQG